MYPWMIFLHVLLGFAFFLAHGASAAVALRLKQEKSVERLRGLMELSASSYGFMYSSLGLLLLTGIVAGFLGRWWGRGWIWSALLALIAITVAMYLLNLRYYTPVRKSSGLPFFERGRPHPPIPPQSDDEILRLVAATRPVLVTVIGLGGMAVVLWLMMFKPF